LYTFSDCSTIGMCIIFFFQAEDGIRDRNVTGVQTCALPICKRVIGTAFNFNTAPVLEIESGSNDPFAYLLTVLGIFLLKGEPVRSEERRVGKECTTWYGEDA